MECTGFQLLCFQGVCKVLSGLIARCVWTFKFMFLRFFLEHLQAECLCGRYRVLTWAFVGLAEYVNTTLKKVWDVKPLNLFLN